MSDPSLFFGSLTVGIIGIGNGFIFINSMSFLTCKKDGTKEVQHKTSSCSKNLLKWHLVSDEMGNHSQKKQFNKLIQISTCNRPILRF